MRDSGLRSEQSVPPVQHPMQAQLAALEQRDPGKHAELHDLYPNTIAQLELQPGQLTHEQLYARLMLSEELDELEHDNEAAA